MADVQGLYLVTLVVLVGLFGWVVVVLLRAPEAVDVTTSPRQAPTMRLKRDDVEAARAAKRQRDEGRATPPGNEAGAQDPSVADASATGAQPEPPGPPARPPETRSVEAGSKPVAGPGDPGGVAPGPVVAAKPDPLRPVVVLPPIRHRLDSHPEIQDFPPDAKVMVLPADDRAPQGARLALATAVGRSDPETGRPPERHAVIEKDHLFVFADGAGRKAGADGVGSLAVDALTDGFAKNEASTFPEDPKLPPRANRVRRAVLEANRTLLKRARAMAFAGLGASGLAAHFSPTNEHLYVAHVGANRAYRLRAGELTRLTSPQGTRQLGLIEKVDVEVVTDPTQPDDLYLFCSDALARVLGESELKAALTADASLEERTRRLIAAVNAKGEAKDAVVIAVRVEAPAPALPKASSGRAKTYLGLG